MQFFLIALLICFVIFLFYLHYAAKEDFVLIRKNISLEQLFDIAFLTGFAALFSARLFYVLFHASVSYLNPLVFFGLPYYPGLSLAGGIVGAGLFLVMYGRNGKLPAARIADFFSVACLLALPFGFFATVLLNAHKDVIVSVLAAALSFALFIFFAMFLLPKIIGSQYKDGTVTYLFLMNFPLVFLLSQIISRATLKQFYFLPDDGVLIALFIIGFMLYLKQEHLPQKKRPAR